MLREFIASTYQRTIGALKDTLLSAFRPVWRNQNFLPIVYVLFLVAILGGLVNAAIQVVPDQGELVYPSAGFQTFAETLLDSFVILVGGAGIYLTYMSGRQTTKARAVNMYLGVALLLLIVSMLAGMQLVLLKGD